MDEKSYSALRADQRLEPESDFLPHLASVASSLLLHKPILLDSTHLCESQGVAGAARMCVGAGEVRRGCT